ncbi:hypothetical protein ACFYO9_28005 [Streptomyces sp. NPDC005863]|uniref:hypothetical protein n=1 Tax=unclassified Streptomyces TaxID=2593676 RepID=UPI00340C268B
MSDPVSYDIHSQAGPFHTGSGSQTIHQYFAPVSAPRPQASRPLPDDHLLWLRRRYVEPDGWGHAERILMETHTVLVDGRPGSGRNATARMLLYAHPELRGNLREVLPEDDSGALLLDLEQVGEREGLLLDLSEADRESWRVLHDKLPGYHAEVRKRGSRLAVVIPSRPLPGPLHPVLEAHRVDIGRPHGLHVLRRALLQEDFAPGTPEQPSPDLMRLLEREPPLRHIARLADLICRARRSRPADTFDDWCSRALEAINRQPEEVAQQVIALADGGSRALLLTTAMLHGEHGARSDAVYEACEALLDSVKHPVDERPLLEREDLSARFNEIRATPDAQGRVTFEAVEYDSAVRTHFWNNMPGLRTRLATWVSRAIALPSLTDADRTALIGHFAKQTLASGGGEGLLAVVSGWWDRQGVFRSAVTQALTHGALDRDAGREIRRRLLDWSRVPRLPEQRAAVLVDVCSAELAAAYPQQAVVRLHHLARRSGGRAAEQQLTALVLSDRRLHRLMLQRLAFGLAGQRWDADVRLFLSLTAADLLCRQDRGIHALIDEKGIRVQLTSGWDSLFRRVPPPRWQQRAADWLTAAGRAQRTHREHLLTVLVDACGKEPLPLARLHELSRRHHVAPLMFRKINEAQGIRPTRPRR